MKCAGIIFIAAFVLSSHVYCQDNGRKIFVTSPVKTQPVIDGVIDEALWDTLQWRSDFVQYKPLEGALPSQKTEFKVLYDDNDIYVAIRAMDTAPDSISNRITARDDIDGDEVGVIFDSYHDQKTAFCFFVSAAGVKRDYISVDDGMEEDETWDPVWYVKTRLWDWGWSAEIRIPLTQLRFAKDKTSTWGMNVQRTIYRLSETEMWQPIPRNASGYAHLLGELKGITDIRPRKQFDLIPYAVTKIETSEPVMGNPWHDGSDFKTNAGLDARIGLSNNTIVSMTVNPDFGQVEADPSEVNLTAFETFFPEKRPFFIESNNITSYNIGLGSGSVGNDNLFYSRRIGRAPHLSPALNTNEVSYTPIATPILGAAKVTSKSPGGLSVGIVEALTTGVETKILDTVTGIRRRVTAEPMTNYTVGRIQRDLNGGRTVIGGIITNTTRFKDSFSDNYLSRSATTGGIDFTRYLGKMNWIIRLRSAFSNITGSENAIAITQTSSVHNFARPGAGYLSYNPHRTSMTGTGGSLLAGKLGGNLQILYFGNWKSPQFELNDLGYLQIADRYTGSFIFNYNIYKPKGIFLHNTYSGNFAHVFDFGGTLQQLAESVLWNACYKNLWETDINIQTSGTRVSNSLLRGGPSIKLPGYLYLSAVAETDKRKKMSAEAALIYKAGYQNRSEESRIISLEVNYRPSPSFFFNVEPSADIEHNELQYVTKVNYNNDPSQPVYIMATLDEKVLSFSLRAEYNITPELSVQYWGQPFICTGRYTDFKNAQNTLSDNYGERFHTFSPRISEVSAGEIYYKPEYRAYMIYEGGEADSNLSYYFSNPNFSFSEFLSNLVVKWEFRPGSVAYLVWSQTRDYVTSDSSFEPASQFSDLFSKNKACNVFLVKFSYRFGLH